MTTLQIIWFLLIGVLLTGFAILDGFDLGVGFWHLGSKGDDERRTLLNAIGPVWDGNEVWLLTGGGAIFAAFPPVYATVFSGFYLAMMLVLLALITRAVSMEFRSKDESPRWRRTWDVAFSLSSILAALLFGVALGNILRGIPMDAQGNFTGNFFTLLNPYALLIGLTGLAMTSFHGALYITLKAPGELETKGRRWASLAGPVYLALYLIATGVTFATQSQLVENFKSTPILWIIPALGPTAIAGAVFFNKKALPGKAFLLSALSIAMMMAHVGASIFPKMVPALTNPEHSLTISNSSSSELTLKVMFVLALIGMPLVITYSVWVYRLFRGKVDVKSKSAHY